MAAQPMMQPGMAQPGMAQPGSPYMKKGGKYSTGGQVNPNKPAIVSPK